MVHSNGSDLGYERRYRLAGRFLVDILKNSIDKERIEKLHPDHANEIINLLEAHYKNPDVKQGILRVHSMTSTILSTTRSEMDKNPDFKALDQYISAVGMLDDDARKHKYPTLDNTVAAIQQDVGAHLMNIYGKYSDFAAKVIAFSVYANLLRKCNNNEAAHWLGVSSTVYGLRQHEKEVQEKRGPSLIVPSRDAAAALMHDVIEMILLRARMPDNKVYGFRNYPQFVNDWLHPDIADAVIATTNFYGVLCDDSRRYIESQKGTVDMDTFLKYLDRIQKIVRRKAFQPAVPHHQDLKLRVEHLRSITEMMKVNPKYARMTGPDLLDEVKWSSYQSYETQALVYGYTTKDLAVPFTKVADWHDNLQGRASIGENARIRNLQKVILGSTDFRKMSEDYESRGIDKTLLNSCVDELSEMAFGVAEDWVVSDLAETIAPVRLLGSVLIRIKDLQSLFYTNGSS